MLFTNTLVFSLSFFSFSLCLDSSSSYVTVVTVTPLWMQLLPADSFFSQRNNLNSSLRLLVFLLLFSFLNSRTSTRAVTVVFTKFYQRKVSRRLREKYL